ncbi:biotin carboxyl carrier domain-containing protein [Bacillus salipaludis]|uniref:Biotin carboxyl carrier protein of acetyl-CoA carboxylase n=1 Tax=Bacillus salipaludis TaxID=2547811 RepID=A0A4R5VQT4_9BACI|nr:biotin/lipoyl-containing protein [Bacillus salipaludis]TDK60958.1 biotin carboxyl carrier domain-containing protein [Bacillus salipaludis]
MSKYESINAPLPGIIYLQPSPEKEQYVKVGDIVKSGDTIALIEVMKTYYELNSEQDGVFEGFTVNSGDIVDAGQEIGSIKIV